MRYGKATVMKKSLIEVRGQFATIPDIYETGRSNESNSRNEISEAIMIKAPELMGPAPG
jgi:hypothetical protein